MGSPRVSVIIPTYGGDEYLGDAIQSVLDQTYSNFELIVVNDASPDATDDVMDRFSDSRIRYIKHETNKGVAHARKTGVMAARGEIIAHLDQDDLYHPDKLSLHVAYLDAHPEIGFTYNSRFELYPTSGLIREILRPSPRLKLMDFVLGFPLAPSVWVQRRQWALQEDIWEEKTFYRGREIVICGRLYMAGCRFAMLDRALNYRRYHKRRIVKNIAKQCEAERTCQKIIFEDPRCPTDVLALRDVAFSNIHTMWAYVAYLQGEVDLARDLLTEAVRLNPALQHGTPPVMINNLIFASIDDEGACHETVLRNIFENLPHDNAAFREYYPWAVRRGYLLQGVRAVMWDRTSHIQEYFSHVGDMQEQFDESFRQWLTSHLLAYEAEFGVGEVSRVLSDLSKHFQKLGLSYGSRKLKGCYFASRAFESFRQGNCQKAQFSVFQAILNDPINIRNRGLISVFLHSTPLSMWNGM